MAVPSSGSASGGSASAGQSVTATRGDLTGELVASDWWTDDQVGAAGIPVIDAPFVTVGGGIGSFITIDYLRIAGVGTDRIRVLSNLDYPWQTYEYLTRVSQIPRTERIRSDSASRPDNIWGFPSYALQESWEGKTTAPLVNTVLEPMWRDFYTPKAGMVFRGLDREARRISYWDMLVRGQVRMIRRRVGGGYFTVLTPPSGTAPTRRVAYRSTYVHAAIGYAGLRYLPDLRDFRIRNQDYHHVVSAYEDHEHVYSQLRTRPGTVLIRGSGVVASRILARLIDDRERYQLQTQIVHLFRTYVAGSHGPSPWMRRRGGNGFAYQGFNYPKSVWGGQLKARMRRLEGAERARAYELMGGTNTPWRRRWQRQLASGRAGRWYHVLAGTVVRMSMAGEQVVSTVRTAAGEVEVAADFIIDCTGLEADIAEHRVLADLLDHGGAGRNPIGRLDVERTFELRGTASPPGALYASGATTLGGYFPGVDTFLGLQIAGLEIADDLARRGFCRRLGPVRSTREWFKWARNRPI